MGPKQLEEGHAEPLFNRFLTVLQLINETSGPEFSTLLETIQLGKQIIGKMKWKMIEIHIFAILTSFYLSRKDPILIHLFNGSIFIFMVLFYFLSNQMILHFEFLV